jgi:sarcosine oxidase, subunit beta
MGTIYVPTDDNFPRTADVVIVGGGLVGVSTAFWASRAGLDTVLIEMRDGLSTLTTSASCECFRAQFTEPALLELARPSIDIFDDFAEIIGIPNYDISLHHQGYLFMTGDEAEVSKVQAAVGRLHDLGVTDTEFLGADEIRRRFPWVSPSVLAGSFRQQDGWLSVHETTQGFAKGSAARYLIRTRVTGLHVDAAGVAGVETSRGSIATRVVVNAAGPYAGRVGKMAGVELPLEPVRRQKVFVAPRPDIPPDAPFTVDLATGVYWRPETGGALVGWVDPDEPPSEPGETLPVDWDFPAICFEKLIALNPFWEKVAEEATREDVRVSAGQYVYTPDDQPLIGRVPDVPGFYCNCGFWAGVMLAPEAGRRTTRLITGELKEEDNSLRPTRYAEGVCKEGGSFLSGH